MATAPEENRFVPCCTGAEVIANEHLGGPSWWLRVRLPAPAPAVAPGQFYMLRAGAGWRPLLARPFSLAGLDARREVLSFLVDRVGAGTEDLCRLVPGEELHLWGPLGNSFPLTEGALLVAGGTGLAPFLRWLELARGILLFGGREAAGVERALRLAGKEKVLTATDDGSAGFQGTVVELLADLLDRGKAPAGSPVFTCGPEPMMAAAGRVAAARGRTCLVSLETAMGCGIGICSGCAVRVVPGSFGADEMVLACRQGPVFAAGQIAWDPTPGS